ncbi:MAG: hypothetical protein AB1482_07105 [Pseudomonadota bacterium]
MLIRWIALLGLFAASAGAWAISPYVQGDPVSGASVQAVASAVEGKLKSGGFKVIGRYFPRGLPDRGVLIATDDAMLDEVGSVGGHAVLGAAIRVGVRADGSVTYSNPDYWYRAYFRKDFDRKEAAVKVLQARLQAALGAGKGVGGNEEAANLTHYRYMIGMERLDSHKNKLASYDSFNDALKAVRDNLAKGTAGTSRVYEIVLPGRKLAVFGVAMHDDADWIRKIEQQEHIAALPYEIYIVDKDVNAPHGRFRIALAFPDVGMGQFMRISSLPNNILNTLGAVAGVDKTSIQEAWQ